MLRKLIADHKPAYMAASFDLAGPTFRDEIVDDYKANRAAMPDDLAEQINWVHQACEALGVPILTAEGYEADDVIGTLATRAAAAGFEVAIVSIDKDFFQLVRDGVRGLRPARGRRLVRRGRRRREVRRASRRRWWTCWRSSAIRATTSPACPGIGKKGAIDLITQYGSLDALLEKRGGAQAEAARGADDASGGGAAKPRAGDDPDRRAARRRLRRAALPRRLARALLRAVLAAGVPHAGQRLRADGGHVQKDYALVSHASRSSTR